MYEQEWSPFDCAGAVTMLGRIFGGLIFLVLTSFAASAQSCGSLPNTLTNGTNADATQVMANFNFLLNCINNGSVTVQQSGRLRYASATQLNFAPFNGSQVKINGALNAIPSGGITGCSNSGVFVNGSAGQNLIASTLYYVYAFVNSGAVTCDFSTTGHATSSTAGNAGTEIKSGDDTRSLVGMVYVNGSGQFSLAWVRSWFNDWGTSGYVSQTSQVNVTSTSAVELDAATRNFVLLWSGENVYATGAVAAGNSNQGVLVYAAIGMNGVSVGGIFGYMSTPFSGYYETIPCGYSTQIGADGLNYFTFSALTGGGTATYGYRQISIISSRR